MHWLSSISPVIYAMIHGPYVKATGILEEFGEAEFAPFSLLF